MVGDALGFIIWRQHSGRRVWLIADDDTDDFGRVDRDGGAADSVVDLDQRDWCAGRAVGWDIDVVQAFEVGVVREVDLHNHLLGEDREAGRIAHRSGWHDVALLGDGHGFDDRDVRQLQLLVAQLLDGFRQVLVDEHHLAVIDGLAQGAVDLEWHAAGQYTGLGQLFVQVIAQAGAGHQADFQRRLLGTFGQCMRYGLGLAGAGEAAHADSHAVLDQTSGISRTHYLAVQGGQADTITVHGLLSRATETTAAQSRDFAHCRPTTMVV